MWRLMPHAADRGAKSIANPPRRGYGLLTISARFERRRTPQ
jgi:hypothetical protein